MRSLVAICLGWISCLIVFGLLLALAWLPELSQSNFYKLSTLLTVAAISIVAGSFLTGKIGRIKTVLHGLLLGFLIGVVSFTYILGINWWVLVAIVGCSALGILGGWLSSIRRDARHAT